MVLHSTFVFCFSLCLDGLQSSKPSLGLLVVSFLFIKSGFFFILLKCPMFGLCCVFIFGLVCLISHLFTSHSTLSAFTSPQALSLWSLSTVVWQRPRGDAPTGGCFRQFWWEWGQWQLRRKLVKRRRHLPVWRTECRRPECAWPPANSMVSTTLREFIFLDLIMLTTHLVLNHNGHIIALCIRNMCTVLVVIQLGNSYYLICGVVWCGEITQY